MQRHRTEGQAEPNQSAGDRDAAPAQIAKTRDCDVEPVPAGVGGRYFGPRRCRHQLSAEVADGESRRRGDVYEQVHQDVGGFHAGTIARVEISQILRRPIFGSEENEGRQVEREYEADNEDTGEDDAIPSRLRKPAVLWMSSRVRHWRFATASLGGLGDHDRYIVGSNSRLRWYRELLSCCLQVVPVYC